MSQNTNLKPAPIKAIQLDWQMHNAYIMETYYELSGLRIEFPNALSKKFRISISPIGSEICKHVRDVENLNEALLEIDDYINMVYFNKPVIRSIETNLFWCVLHSWEAQTARARQAAEEPEIEDYLSHKTYC